MPLVAKRLVDTMRDHYRCCKKEPLGKVPRGVP